MKQKTTHSQPRKPKARPIALPTLGGAAAGLSRAVAALASALPLIKTMNYKYLFRLLEVRVYLLRLLLLLPFLRLLFEFCVLDVFLVCLRIGFCASLCFISRRSLVPVDGFADLKRRRLKRGRTGDRTSDKE